jgi:S1-C subfamily serine protease
MKRTTIMMLVGLSCAGCHQDRGSSTPNVESVELGPACGDIGVLTDTALALRGTTTPHAGHGVFALARTEEELAYVELALAALEDESAQRSDALVPTLSRLEELLEARRSSIDEALTRTRDSYIAVHDLVEQAAACEGVDLRERPKQGSRSKACQAAVRLWNGLRDVDLTSSISARSRGAHIQEYQLAGPVADLRTRVSEALIAHASNLEALDQAVDLDFTSSSDREELGKLRHDTSRSITQRHVQCLGSLRSTTISVQATRSDLRAATVLVRPKWSGPVADIAEDDGVFGTGFVVRWRASDGSMQTRIITNAHVLAGAAKAEIVPADAEGIDRRASDRGDQKDNPLVATLVRALPDDDIAVLQVQSGPKARQWLPQSIVFRTSAAKEQERVLAAGFPGLGGRPSYQVTEGIVSNAGFGASEHDEDGVSALLQHTAAIDPGNSGGPLLDEAGQLLGMNTLKAGTRENVGFAIPSVRIQLALARANEEVQFTERHAQAACNIAAAALANDTPHLDETERFGLALYRDFEQHVRSATAVNFRQQVAGGPTSTLEFARLRLYGAIRAAVVQEGQVTAYTTCGTVRRLPDEDGKARFSATLLTQEHEHAVILGPEDGRLRVTNLD